LREEIAQRERAAEHIQKQAALLDLALDAICVTDTEQRIRYWNKGAERLYGWTAGEAAGKKVDEFLFRSGASFVTRAMKSLLLQGEWQGEMEHAAKAGPVVVNSRWTLVRDAAGEPESILMFHTDLTAQKKLETQFLRTQRLEGIGTLASGVAHDLNNILAPIMMAVPMLRWGLIPEEFEKMLGTIEASAQRGSELVKQLLTFGRGVEGKRRIIRAEPVVREIVKMAQQTFPKLISVTSTIDPDLWPIFADATQVHQVLLNLCINARDSMPEGGGLAVTVGNLRLDDQYVSMNPESATGPYVRFQVSDTGTGISPDVIPNIFEPFFTTKEPGKGTGLGLSTLLGIVKGHGGFLNVQSQVGKGTTFEIFLPATPDQLISADLPAAAPPLEGHGECILVVDDEPIIREVTQKTLEGHGYRVLVAGDGVEALAMYEQHQHDIEAVMTDLAMPFLDGVGTIRGLKKINPMVKVIAASGHGSTNWRSGKLNQLTALGVTTFLAKPFKADKLLVLLQEIVRKGRGSQGREPALASKQVGI